MQTLLAGLAVGLALLMTPVAHGAEMPFDQAAFTAAVDSGRSVAVVFHADWCPVCRAQAPVLKELMAEPAQQSLALFVADFDTALDLRKQLHVVQQSTIVVFHKGREVTRSTGDTRRDALASLLAQAAN